MTSRPRVAVVAMYVAYAVVLVPLVVVFFVALAFYGFGGEFLAPSGAFLLLFLLLWPAGLVLSIVIPRHRLRLGYSFLAAVLVAIAGFAAYVALGT